MQRSKKTWKESYFKTGSFNATGYKIYYSKINTFVKHVVQ